MKQHLFWDDTLGHMFRRLAWSPEGETSAWQLPPCRWGVLVSLQDLNTIRRILLQVSDVKRWMH